MAVTASDTTAAVVEGGPSKTSSQAPAPRDAEPAAPSPPVAATMEETARHGHGHKAHTGFWGLAIGSIGVVFGDIGTSPLYAFQAAMTQAAHDPITRPAILGVVSLALWALILVVTIKYVLFVMRADNKGEGGVLSLMALAQRAMGKRTTAIFLLGVVGAALFYGDAIITPGHLGARRLPGHERRAGAEAHLLAAPDHRRLLPHPDRRVRGAVAGHRQHRQAVRAGDGAVVPGDRDARPSPTSPTARRCCSP